MSSDDMRKKYWEQSVNFKSNFSTFKPNKGHEAIATIINSKENGHCVTQNVDNLHQAAGLADDQVTEIHGNATYAVCLNCEKKFELEPIHQAFKENQESPSCQDCKGFIKTATISFGQPMPEKEMMRAQMKQQLRSHGCSRFVTCSLSSCNDSFAWQTKRCQVCHFK